MWRAWSGWRGRGRVRAAHTASSSSEIRARFLEHFRAAGHARVRSSAVVPLCDPSVPFVNAGMHQFKGIFLGRHSAPHPRVVNSQKCIRVGGKHNDLELVGMDGTHHTFFEMLGNWSFGDYYKNEACRLAWELLTGPYGLKPEELVVTYFAGDRSLSLDEDKETRDIWRKIGLQKNKINPLGMADNFWEMGLTGPCGPCTEIHYLNGDGSLTEIWNIVFIQYNRQADGSIALLPKRHVDTGLGLERATALLQGVASDYDTDLFLPIIKAIEKSNSKLPGYTGKFGSAAELDCAYRCLADHARMISVCLADGMFPGSSLNLKQIMRKSFKLSHDVFQCKSELLSHLYDRVSESLGPTYPELITKMKDAKKIIEHEEQSYHKLRRELAKKWKDLVKQHPEVEELSDVELPGFAEGYKQFKQAMSDVKSSTIPGEVIFKLHDTHGFNEQVIERIAQLNKCTLDKDGFHILLTRHRKKHKTAFKEQADANRALQFNKAIQKLNDSNIFVTNDELKYYYTVEKCGDITFPPLQSEVTAILNNAGEWLETVETNDKENFYLVTKDTNFYCEEGGQAADVGKIIISDDIYFKVASVFKVRDIVFHKGEFNGVMGRVGLGACVVLKVNEVKRLNLMRNHTATHLLNAAIREVLPNSVCCQVGSSVSENGLVLNLAVYGQKLSQTVILEAQSLIRRTIGADVRVETVLVDSMDLSRMEGVQTVPGETYPDTGLRLVQVTGEHLSSRELCCGTHVPSTRHIEEFCITSVKGAGGHAPIIRALTGDSAKEVHKLTSTAQVLQQNAIELDEQRLEEETTTLRRRLTQLCGGQEAGEGAPHGEHKRCLEVLEALHRQTRDKHDVSLNSVAEIEMRNMALEADALGRPFIVHFLMCSYLMESASLVSALAPCQHKPTMLFGCAQGIMKVASRVPESYQTKEFTADKWLRCVLPVFQAEIASPGSNAERLETFATMTDTKVSLIDCESQVHDAMKVAIAYASRHTKDRDRKIPSKEYGDMADKGGDDQYGHGQN